ncbi:MAG: tetratricopeptide repeat protein [Desulfatibacillum sp.]|nr:tetratricopeptide repeat protein [Desulfatibacillum sp.]
MKPFWKRMDKFFTYPFHANPLILLVTIAFFSAVLRGMPMGWLLRMLLSAAMLNYAYLALRRTAQGDLTPPKMYDEALTAGVGAVLAQVVLFILLGVAGIFIGAQLGGAAMIIYGIVVMFFLPSMLIILVMDGNPFRAMNPASFMALPFRIGGGYFIMWLFLLFLMFAPGSLLYLVSEYVPTFLNEFLDGVFGNYYMLVAYHLMGYVLLQYHSELGYDIDYEDMKDSDKVSVVKADNRATEAAKHTAFLFTEGKHDEAIEYISRYQALEGEFSRELSERYFALLKIKGEKDKLVAHGPILLDLLAENNAKAKALDAYGVCMGADPGFSPEPGALFKIAGWLAETGNPKGAINAYGKFTKSFPDNRDVPIAYFRAAQIFNDRLMNPKKAKSILTGLLKKYPAHDIAPKVKNYLQHIGG